MLTMLDRGVWTKGRYVATRHRVRQTAGDYRTGCRDPKLRQGWDMFQKHGDGVPQPFLELENQFTPWNWELHLTGPPLHFSMSQILMP